MSSSPILGGFTAAPTARAGTRQPQKTVYSVGIQQQQHRIQVHSSSADRWRIRGKRRKVVCRTGIGWLLCACMLTACVCCLLRAGANQPRPAAGVLPLAGCSCAPAAAANGEGASASMACAAARAPGGSGGGEVGSRGDVPLEGAPVDDAAPSVRAVTGAEPGGLGAVAAAAAPAAPAGPSSPAAAAAASAAAASGGSCSSAMVWEPLRPQLPVLLKPLGPLFTLPDAPAAPGAPTGTPSPCCCAAATPATAAAAADAVLMLLCRLLLRLLLISRERSASVQASDTSGTAAEAEGEEGAAVGLWRQREQRWAHQLHMRQGWRCELATTCAQASTAATLKHQTHLMSAGSAAAAPPLRPESAAAPLAPQLPARQGRLPPPPWHRGRQTAAAAPARAPRLWEELGCRAGRLVGCGQRRTERAAKKSHIVDQLTHSRLAAHTAHQRERWPPARVWSRTQGPTAQRQPPREAPRWGSYTPPPGRQPRRSWPRSPAGGGWGGGVVTGRLCQAQLKLAGRGISCVVVRHQHCKLQLHVKHRTDTCPFESVATQRAALLYTEPCHPAARTCTVVSLHTRLDRARAAACSRQGGSQRFGAVSANRCHVPAPLGTPGDGQVATHNRLICSRSDQAALVSRCTCPNPWRGSLACLAPSLPLCPRIDTSSGTAW